MKKYKHILLDLDGTVTDPVEGITKSVEYALNQFGITVEDRRELITFIGPPLVDSFHRFYGFDEEQCLQAVAYYREYFSPTGIFENVVYDGMEQMLKEWKEQGLKLYLATSKPEVYAVRILEHFHLDHYFTYMGGSLMHSRLKKGEVIEYVLETNGLTGRDDVIMVGDRSHDILGAKEHGLDSVGILYGYGNEQEFKDAGATYILETVEELKQFFL